MGHGSKPLVKDFLSPVLTPSTIKRRISLVIHRLPYLINLTAVIKYGARIKRIGNGHVARLGGFRAEIESLLCHAGGIPPPPRTCPYLGQ